MSSALETFEQALYIARQRETPRWKIVGCRMNAEFLRRLSEEARSISSPGTDDAQLRTCRGVTLYIGLVEIFEFDFGLNGVVEK